MSRTAGRFTRVEFRRRARKLLLGLPSGLPCKNCWIIAEWAGDRTPDGMRHLLGRAEWDADQVRDEVGDYVVQHLHDDEAVLVVDETGDVKKCTGTVGVLRQYNRCCVPAAVPPTTLVRVAGSRRRVEEFLQSGKGLAALDEHQVGRYSSWFRWATPAMLAHAFLAVLRTNEHDRHPAPDELIPLTCDEIRRMFITLVNRPVFDPLHRLGRSVWRRRRQARSRTSHYRRQAAQA
ncbi:transposase [Streptomyces sp. NPDC059786]|uniref:transposase n=1 Tax=Streptomyces sp. NPDC059786 TaxID=3346946 RepID=UPI003647A8CF